MADASAEDSLAEREARSGSRAELSPLEGSVAVGMASNIVVVDEEEVARADEAAGAHAASGPSGEAGDEDKRLAEASSNSGNRSGSEDQISHSVSRSGQSNSEVESKRDSVGVERGAQAELRSGQAEAGAEGGGTTGFAEKRVGGGGGESAEDTPESPREHAVRDESLDRGLAEAESGSGERGSANGGGREEVVAVETSGGGGGRESEQGSEDGGEREPVDASGSADGGTGTSDSGALKDSATAISTSTTINSRTASTSSSSSGGNEKGKAVASLGLGMSFLSSSLNKAAKAVQTRARHLVSQNHRRFQEDGFDLDLTYVTDSIIAMGFPGGDPSSGLLGFVEGLYRNHMDDVIRFLELRHSGRYKVYNLCSERLYDADRFQGKVACFPFDDGTCPPLALTLALCESAKGWLAGGRRTQGGGEMREGAHGGQAEGGKVEGEGMKEGGAGAAAVGQGLQEEVPGSSSSGSSSMSSSGGGGNVVVVHCKAGMGRTGLVVACLLLALKVCSTAAEAIALFRDKRSVDGKAITSPSQQRHVAYYEAILRASSAAPVPSLPTPRPLVLRGIRLHRCPYWIRPALTVSSHSGLIFSSKTHPRTAHLSAEQAWHAGQRQGVVLFALPGERFICPLQDDFCIAFHDSYGDFSCWLHTSFLEARHLLKTTDLDGFDKRRLASPGFVVELLLLPHTPHTQDAPHTPNTPDTPDTAPQQTAAAALADTAHASPASGGSEARRASPGSEATAAMSDAQRTGDESNNSHGEGGLGVAGAGEDGARPCKEGEEEAVGDGSGSSGGPDSRLEEGVGAAGESGVSRKHLAGVEEGAAEGGACKEELESGHDSRKGGSDTTVSAATAAGSCGREEGQGSIAGNKGVAAVDELGTVEERQLLVKGSAAEGAEAGSRSTAKPPADKQRSASAGAGAAPGAGAAAVAGAAAKGAASGVSAVNGSGSVAPSGAEDAAEVMAAAAVEALGMLATAVGWSVREVTGALSDAGRKAEARRLHNTATAAAVADAGVAAAGVAAAGVAAAVGGAGGGVASGRGEVAGAVEAADAAGRSERQRLLGCDASGNSSEEAVSISMKLDFMQDDHDHDDAGEEEEEDEGGGNGAGGSRRRAPPAFTAASPGSIAPRSSFKDAFSYLEEHSPAAAAAAAAKPPAAPSRGSPGLAPTTAVAGSASGGISSPSLSPVLAPGVKGGAAAGVRGGAVAVVHVAGSDSIDALPTLEPQTDTSKSDEFLFGPSTDFALAAASAADASLFTFGDDDEE